jgi:NAD(P)-dependent dehydrogenase (short-subunit alcohol dehydrogenase family)
MLKVPPTGRFHEKVAVVTGGAQGLGRAIVERLASEGARIFILDRDQEATQDALRELESEGVAVAGRTCDVTERRQVESAVADVVKEVGRISVLVNNAGIGRRAPFLEMADETWNEVINGNLNSQFIVGQVVAREMAKAGGGRIVNMASTTTGRIAHSEQSAYGVSKAGIVSLTRFMAFELAPLGIAVNAVAPGTIAAGIAAKGMLSDEAKAERIRRIPLGRFGTAAEVASVVAFLASSDAGYMTGAVLPVDGGLLIAGIRV